MLLVAFVVLRLCSFGEVRCDSFSKKNALENIHLPPVIRRFISAAEVALIFTDF